jgi:hypothetical protein
MKLLAKSLASVGICLGAAFALPAQEPQTKPDYTELSKLIRARVLKEAPKEFSASVGWGQSTPFPPKLRLPNVPRVTMKVGDHLELAHGPWKKAKVWMDNRDRDFTLAVTDLKPSDSSQYRLSLTSAAPLNIDYEFQRWVNGLMLLGINGRAKAKIKVDLDCDVGLTLNVSKFPPEVTVEPKIAKTKIEIQEFQVFNPGPANQPNLAQNINEEVRGFLQGIVRDAEPQIQEEANKAIAQALRDGKGTISASKLYDSIKK